MIDKVEQLMRQVAAEVVAPRFRRLDPDEVEEKGPGDLVTAADREAEALLTSGLRALLPESVVIGEEAVAADSSLLAHVGADGPVWLVDPVDGTANFAAGKQPFAVMVALLHGGQTTAAWILDPVDGVAAVAERGSGAFLAGARITVPNTAKTATELSGPTFTRYIPPDVRTGILSRRDQIGELLAGRNCAGWEYPAIVRDEQQFALFWRTLPWDHAPGALFVEEAGGVAWRLDGTPYHPADSRTGLLVAQTQQVWDTVRSTLLAGL